MERKKRSAGDVDIHVASRLACIRKAARRTQLELSDILGVSFQQYQKYENGKNRMSAETLYKLADTLGVKVSDFFDGLGSQKADREGKVFPFLDKDTIKLLSVFQRIKNKDVRKTVLRMLMELENDTA